MAGEVEVPAEDATHVGAGEHVGQASLVEQLDDLGRPQHRHRDRRVVQREQRAVRRGRGQDTGQPGQLLVAHLAVVVARHAGVERHDPQPGDVVHPVLGARVVGVVQPGRVRRPLVVVAHHPHHLGAHRGGGRLDQLPKPGVRRGLGPVGQVPGEDQRLRRRIDVRQAFERADDAGLGVDAAVLAAAVGEQVRVAQVGDDVTGSGVLAELHAGQASGPRNRELAQFAPRNPASRRSFPGARENCADSVLLARRTAAREELPRGIVTAVTRG